MYKTNFVHVTIGRSHKARDGDKPTSGSYSYGATCTANIVTRGHRRSQDFLWGALFFPEKFSDFLVVALKTT